MRLSDFQWHFINWSYCLSLHPTRSARLSEDFAAQYTAYVFPLSTLNSTPYDAKSMSKDLGGVLTLPSKVMMGVTANRPVRSRIQGVVGAGG